MLLVKCYDSWDVYHERYLGNVSRRGSGWVSSPIDKHNDEHYHEKAFWGIVRLVRLDEPHLIPRSQLSDAIKKELSRCNIECCITGLI